MERALYFEKFRNIGLEQRERLVLNNSLEKGKMGNLVVLIGANNSGKSNVLSGLTTFATKKITDRDVTTLSFEDEYRKPQLTLSVKDENDVYSYCVRIGEPSFVKYPNDDKEIKFPSEIDQFANDIKQFVSFCVGVYNQNSPHYSEQLTLLAEKLCTDRFNRKEAAGILTESMKEYFSLYGLNNRAWNDFSRRYPSSGFCSIVNEHFGNINIDEKIIKAFKEKYGIGFFPQIISYEERRLTNNSICCTVNNITTNEFFSSLFKKIEMTSDEIINAYKAFNMQHNKGVLKTLEIKINSKLEAVANDFNELYFVEEDKYRFEISLETDSVYFLIFRGTKDLSLDYQSSGFKWFFNLYFNLLSKNSLNPGDILIMDEPATNLHILGQQELRKFLKEFAMKNDITIVIATHSPAFIDLDYLDEVRVILMHDNVSKIVNDYTTVDLEDPDSLKPIKNALTVRNHVLLDPDKTVVFVEGITDYNYYTAFKKKFGIGDEIVFLPIKGIGNIKSENFKEKQKDISKSLIEIKKHNPILLVDADKSGLEMKQANKESALEVITLKDIDEQFKQVEDLFDKEDLKLINAVDESGTFIKKSSTSSIVKTFVDQYDLSEITINNFKKVLDKLMEKN